MIGSSELLLSSASHEDKRELVLNTAAPAFVELIKIEKFSTMWPSLLKLDKPFQLMLGFL